MKYFIAVHTHRDFEYKLDARGLLTMPVSMDFENLDSPIVLSRAVKIQKHLINQESISTHKRVWNEMIYFRFANL